ncbi:MAG: transcription termination factor Rho, partial [Mesotoga sp.]|nr:transcription termination factor Rho [Mesotoga sp.]
MDVPSNLSPRKKKTEETPNELDENVVSEKKPTRKRTTRKKTEVEKPEKKEETLSATSNEIEGSVKENEVSLKRDAEKKMDSESESQESTSESTTDESKELPRKDKDKDKDNIREVEIDISQLQAMPIREVYKLARKYDVQGYTQMAKKDLIFAVLKAQTESYGYFFDQGVLEITDGGYGFLRTLDNNLLPSSNDIYVSQSQIRRFNLTSGDTVAGQVRPPKEGEKYFALLRIEAINHKAINFAAERITFQNLTPIHPEDRLITETDSHIMSTRMVDLFSPIGKGQRGLIVSPPKAGKTILLKELANGIAENHPDTIRIILLIDERPEEVTDLRRSTNAHVIAAPFDMHPEKQIRVAEMTIEMAK